MADPGLVERLSRHRLVGAGPRAEWEWLAEHGELEFLARGEVHIRKGEQARRLHIVLEGRLVIRADRGAGSQKIFEWLAGDASGLLPYSRGASPPNHVVAEETTEVLAIGREWFPELTRACPELTARLVHVMVDRARQFTWADLRDERLLSLGRLAAGLAHELNNPATSALRGARTLVEAQAAAEAATQRLAAARLSESQLGAIEALRRHCAPPGLLPTLPALEFSDREEAMSDWLVRHGVEGAFASAMVTAGLTPADLQSLAEVFSDRELEPALQWIATGCEIRALASAIETSALRIHDLVHAVKGFTYMDQAPAAQPVDVARGLADTLTVLRAKIRARSARIELRGMVGLPLAHGVGGELNQVWMNLLDNALDAIEPGGLVIVEAGIDLGRLVVKVVDDGHGIPPEQRERIFEPFFTTKGVGQGTGLGLDIVRRVLHRHDGGIEVDSRPGRTEFRVRLPLAESGT